MKKLILVGLLCSFGLVFSSLQAQSIDSLLPQAKQV